MSDELRDVELEAEYERGTHFGCLAGLILGILIGAFVMWVSSK